MLHRMERGTAAASPAVAFAMVDAEVTATDAAPFDALVFELLRRELQA
jgi:hypothetical protein